MGKDMTTDKSPVHMEAAGSLTPELEGVPASSRHPRRAEAAGGNPQKKRDGKATQVKP